jgi:hypothetical protein
MRTKLVLAVAVATAVQLLPGTARANDAGNSRPVATGSTYCITESILLRNDSTQGVKTMYSRGTVRSYKPGCETARNRPVQHLAQTFYVFFKKTLGESGDGALCLYSDWSYNQKADWAYKKVIPASEPYCGRGYYNVAAYGYTWESNAWRGDGVNSGWLYFD